MLTKWAIDNLGWQGITPNKNEIWYSKENVTEKINSFFGNQPINWENMFDDKNKVFTESDANALRSLLGDSQFTP
jgi:hypothetical protein